MDVQYEIEREKVDRLALITTVGADEHFHNQIELVVVTEGFVSVTEGSVTRRLGENEAAIADSYIPHAYRKEKGGNATAVIVPKEFLTDYRAVMNGKTFLDPFLPADRGCRVRRLVELLGESFDRIGYDERWRGLHSDRPTLTVRGLVNAILGEFVEGCSLTARVGDSTTDMRDVLLYLSDNFTERITLTDLARKFGYAPTHFSRVFNSYTGRNLNEYLGTLRAEHAAGLILGGQSVTDAAMNAGFQSMRTFYRAFSRRYGCRPAKLSRREVERQSKG